MQLYDHQAEGMITSFLLQHQAAKDYLYMWLGAGPNTEDNSNVKMGDTTPTSPGNFLKAEYDNSTPPNPRTFNFEVMMPSDVGGIKFSAVSDMCAGNEGVPGTSSCRDPYDPDGEPIPGFVSRLVCLNSTNTLVHNCGDSSVTKRYVMTYGGWENGYNRPNWWPTTGQSIRRFESWRKAIANRTRGSISCGFLFSKTDTATSNSWCIDNGETSYKTNGNCQNAVPEAVIDVLPSDYKTTISDVDYANMFDMLFCLSPFKQGISEYEGSPTHFYDGLANIGFGQRDSTATNWTDLASGGGNIDVSGKGNWDHPTAFHLTTGALDDIIQLSSGGRYTLTIIAASNSNEFNIFTTTDGTGTADENIIFQKSGRLDDVDAFVLKAREAQRNAVGPDTVYTASACNIRYDGRSAEGYSDMPISWTFVIKGCDDDHGGSGRSCIDVYENAQKRAWFSDRQIDPDKVRNKYLKIGGSGGVADIYGIRYYEEVLTPKQIEENFKVDQKRFGLPDINNKQNGHSETDAGGHTTFSPYCVNEKDGGEKIEDGYPHSDFTAYSPSP